MRHASDASSPAVIAMIRRIAAVFRAGVSTSLVMFVIETSLSHLLAMVGFGWDDALTLRLWLEHLGLYIAAGLAAAVMPAIWAIGSRSDAPRRVVPWVVLALYLTLLVSPRLVPVLGYSAFPVVTVPVLAVGLFAARQAARGSSGAGRWLLETGLWSGLLMLGVGALLNLRVLAGSVVMPRNLAANAILLAACCVVAGVARRRVLRAAGTPGDASASRDAVAAESGAWRVRRAGVWAAAALTYGAVALSAASVAEGLASTETPEVSELPPSIEALPGKSSPRPEGGASSSSVATRSPDILLIIIDSLRADRLGAYGYARARTPNLDTLARRSTRYALHLASSSWTYPSVGSMLTGVSPTAHRATLITEVMGQRADRGRFGASPLRPDLPTLATALKAQGYETALIGTNPYLTGIFGFSRGFDHYEVLQRSGVKYVTLPSGLASVGWRPLDPRDPTLPAGEMTGRFLAWLESPRRNPALLVAHYMDPHFPYNPPARFREGLGTPPEDRVRPIERLSDLYDAEIAYVDTEIGRLIGRLEAAGRLRNMVIAVTSDHGETFLDHGTWVSWDEMPSGFDPYASRGIDHGQSMYQELIHVPLLIYHPGEEGRVESGMSRAVDLLPTLLSAAGAPIPPGIEGRVLEPSVGVAPGRGAEGRGAEPSATETPAPALSESLLSGLEKKSWCDGRYKLIYKPDYPPGQQLELYDLAVDPGEQRDLAGQEPGRATAMEKALLRHLLELSRPADQVRPVTLDRATVERLEALGYIGKGKP